MLKKLITTRDWVLVFWVTFAIVLIGWFTGVDKTYRLFVGGFLGAFIGVFISNGIISIIRKMEK